MNQIQEVIDGLRMAAADHLPLPSADTNNACDTTRGSC